MYDKELLQLHDDVKKIKRLVGNVLYSDGDRWLIRAELPDDAKNLLVRMFYDLDEVSSLLLEEAARVWNPEDEVGGGRELE